MATYQTIRFAPQPLIPIIRVKDVSIQLPETFYVTRTTTTDSDQTAETQTLTRAQILEKIRPYLQFVMVWQNLKIASAELVSDSDLVAILEMLENQSKYGYSSKANQTAEDRFNYIIAVIELILKGYTPEQARLLDDKELILAKYPNFPTSQPNYVDSDPNLPTLGEPATQATKPSNLKYLIIGGGLLYFLTRK
ncbi:MAG: hypothetical protein ABIN80_28625 [Dyadobacter sp.]|uniref:hypothetical protein n=1 Tax=Dyadobacter sp. TaxID=1914288 RepID=UPI003265FB30